MTIVRRKKIIETGVSSSQCICRVDNSQIYYELFNSYYLCLQATKHTHAAPSTSSGVNYKPHPPTSSMKKGSGVTFEKNVRTQKSFTLTSI